MAEKYKLSEMVKSHRIICSMDPDVTVLYRFVPEKNQWRMWIHSGTLMDIGQTIGISTSLFSDEFVFDFIKNTYREKKQILYATDPAKDTMITVTDKMIVDTFQ